MSICLFSCLLTWEWQTMTRDCVEECRSCQNQASRLPFLPETVSLPPHLKLSLFFLLRICIFCIFSRNTQVFFFVSSFICSSLFWSLIRRWSNLLLTCDLLLFHPTITAAFNLMLYSVSAPFFLPMVSLNHPDCYSPPFLPLPPIQILCVMSPLIIYCVFFSSLLPPSISP